MNRFITQPELFSLDKDERHSCYTPRRTAKRKRILVSDCMVESNFSNFAIVIGQQVIPGLTNFYKERSLKEKTQQIKENLLPP